VHGDLRLVCSCLAMENHFMKVLTNSSCADVASRGSLELSRECCNRGDDFLHATSFSTRRSHSMSLCGLPLHGLAVVTPRCFYLTITALIVDQGSSSSAEIWWTD
jgi:hypothetical protein